MTASDTPTFYIATMSPGVYDGPAFTAALNNDLRAHTPHIDVAYPGSDKLAIS